MNNTNADNIPTTVTFIWKLLELSNTIGFQILFWSFISIFLVFTVLHCQSDNHVPCIAETSQTPPINPIEDLDTELWPRLLPSGHTLPSLRGLYKKDMTYTQATQHLNLILPLAKSDGNLTEIDFIAVANRTVGRKPFINASEFDAWWEEMQNIDAPIDRFPLEYLGLQTKWSAFDIELKSTNC